MCSKEREMSSPKQWVVKSVSPDNPNEPDKPDEPDKCNQ